MPNNNLNKPNVAIVTHAFSSKLGEIFPSSLIKIIEPSVNEIFVISGNFEPEELISNERIHLRNVKPVKEDQLWFIKILKYIPAQLKMCVNLAKISSNIDIVIFAQGSTWLTLPLLFAKLLRKKVIVVVVAYTPRIAAKTYSNTLFGKGEFVFSNIFMLSTKISYTLSDQIIIDINVESERLIHQFGLAKYRDKISFGGAPLVDVNSFRIKKKLKDRKNIIGYTGRHSPEKGVMNFAMAIPLILKERNDLEFIIGSGGPLFGKIKDELKKNGSYDKVTLTGWAPRGKIPDYFNEMKLIVVPSYTETIPTVIMEAMACGTPVVASPVDAIPDLIRDSENGFLMEDNSPECIAKNVIRALDDPRLDEIVKNAHNLINREYTYDAAVENYRKLLIREG